MTNNSNAPIRILQWGMTSGLGGLETFLMNVYRHIDRSQVQFDFLQAHDEKKLVFEDEINDLGGHVYRVMYSQRESLYKSRTCLNHFFAEHTEFSGLHVNANFRYAFPLKYAKQAGINLRILHSHNINEEHSNGFPKEIAWKIRTSLVQHDISALPTHYFACSAAAANFMFPNTPYFLVKNGISTKTFKFNPKVRNTLRMQLGIPQTTTVLGFCGNLREQKNPLFAVDIFSAYHHMNPNSILLIIGDGELRFSVENRLRFHGIENSVRMLGQQRDTASWYQAMDAFILPSRYEGLGIVYIEAQCAGLPCFAPRGNVPQEVGVTNLLTFIEQNTDPEEWANIIRKQLSSATSRITYAEKVKNAGYEIADVAAWLQSFYIENTKGN